MRWGGGQHAFRRMEAPPPSRRQDRARRAPRLPGLDEDDYEVTSVSGGGIDVGATVRRKWQPISRVNPPD